MVNDYSDEGKLFIVPYDVRFRPIAPPEVGIFDEPTAKICINVEWLGHIDGALERLLWRDAWDGDQETQLAAAAEVRKVLAKLHERVACDCEDCMNCEELTECLAPLITSQNMQAYQIAIREAERIQQEYEDAWDGTPESINPAAPSDNFDGDSSPERDEALCAAASAFVRYFATNKVRQLDVVYGGLFTALALPLILVPGFGWAAALALGLALGGATLVAGATYSSAKAALQDESALDAVACCLADGLEGETISLSNFEAGLSGCGFTGGTNAAIVRDFVAAALAGNFYTFIDFLGDAKKAIDNGEPVFCPCSEPWCVSLTAGNGLDTLFVPFVGVPGIQAEWSGTGWQATAAVPGRITLDGDFGIELNLNKVEVLCTDAVTTGTDNYQQFSETGGALNLFEDAAESAVFEFAAEPVRYSFLDRVPSTGNPLTPVVPGEIYEIRLYGTGTPPEFGEPCE